MSGTKPAAISTSSAIRRFSKIFFCMFPPRHTGKSPAMIYGCDLIRVPDEGLLDKRARRGHSGGRRHVAAARGCLRARLPRLRGVLPRVAQHRLGRVRQGQGGGRRKPILRNISTRQQRRVRMCQNKTPGRQLPTLYLQLHTGLITGYVISIQNTRLESEPTSL